MLGTPGEKSFRTTWDDGRARLRPEVVVCAPCGFDLPASAALAEALVTSDVLPEDVPVWAVDANASFARPGPRLVDGVEALAGILHPERGRRRARSPAGSAEDQTAPTTR